MILLIAIILTAMIFSFFCSLMEACLLSLSRLDTARMAEHRPLAGAIWHKLRKNIQKPLAAVLIINTLANVIGSFFAGAEFNRLYGNKLSLGFSVLFSYMLIQWCEILPKTLGVRHNRSIAGITALPFNTMVTLLTPVIRMIEFMNRPFSHKRHASDESAVSDIRVLARYAALENQISKEQESLIARSVHMSTLRARDVMIDRNDINILSTGMSLQNGLIAAHLHRHTRFPLAENGDINKIVGYVNFKDIVGALQISPSDPTLRGIMRPVLFVREDHRLPELLTKLTRGYHHIAIVHNGKGETLGLITLEDIIESLVGDLQDEYDTPPDFIVRLSETRFRIGGGATFRQLKARAFPELTKDDDTTVDGWFKSLTKGKKPPENQIEKIGDISFKIRRVVRGNIYDAVGERIAPVKREA